MRAFCAAIIAGQCTLMPPNRQRRTLEQLRLLYSDSYLLGDEVGEPEFSIGSDTSVPDIDEDQLCAIVFTSGSTGAPQPNKKFWRTIRDGAKSNFRLLLDDWAVGHINMVATVPPQHNYGLEMSVALPMLGPVAISDSTPFYPQEIADATSGLPEPVVLVSSPVHLDALLRSGVEPGAIARIFSATAPLAKELAKNLEKTFATHVQDVFGCTESGIIATRHVSTEELWTYADVFTLRVSSRGAEIRASHLPEHVLMPDIVELVGERQYRWLGRQADMVNIAGKRGSLADLNLRLREVPGVIDGIIFTREDRPDRLAALVVAPGMGVSDILKDLKERIEPVFLPRPMYKIDMLPRQETGKIAVKLLQDMFNRIRETKAN